MSSKRLLCFNDEPVAMKITDPKRYKFLIGVSNASAQCDMTSKILPIAVANSPFVRKFCTTNARCSSANAISMLNKNF